MSHHRSRPSPHLLRGSAHLLVTVAVNGVGGFAFWWLAAWRNPSTDVGAAQGLFTGLMAMTCLTSMGLPVLLARFSTDESRESAGLFRWSLAYTALTSTVGAAVLVAVAPASLLQPIGGAGRLAAGAMVAALGTGLSCAALVEVRLMALRRWGWVLGRVVLVVAMRLPLLWVPVMATSRWLFVLVAGAPALSGIVGAVVLHRSSAGAARWWATPPAALGERLRYATVHHVGLVGSQGPMFLIPLVVAVRVGSGDYAAFYLAWAIAQTVFVVPHMLGQTFLVEAAKSHLGARHQVRFTLALSTASMACAALGSLVAGPLLASTLDAAYAPVRALLPWLLAGCIPWAVTSTALAEARLHHHSVTTVLVTATFFATAVGFVGLAAPGGLIAAARAWLVANLVTATVAAVVLLWSRSAPAVTPWPRAIELTGRVELDPVLP